MPYKDLIKNVPDFPKKGILFKDISPIFEDYGAFHSLVSDLAALCKGFDFDKFALIESRGFLLGPALSLKLEKPFCLIRKKGKLPRKTYSQSYDLEYGQDSLEVHQSSIKKEEKILIIDDLLATGGTVSAVEKLIEKSQGHCAGTLCIVELVFLKGRLQLQSKFKSLIRVEA